MTWHSTDVPVAVRGPLKVEQAVCGLLYPQVYYLGFWWEPERRIKAPLQFSWDSVTCSLIKVHLLTGDD